MPNKYIGLTIGPLYKTMKSVRATRELWASSYIFSYIMKKMIEKLKAQREFIIPYTKDSKIFQSGQEVGLFHDRFIFEAQNGDFYRVEEVKKQVLQDLADEMSKRISEKESAKILPFLERYFQIYFCEVEVNGGYREVNKTVNEYLDGLELQEKFVHEEQRDKNYLLELFDRVNKSFLMKDAYNANHSFLSIPEIAALKGRTDLEWTNVNISYKQGNEDDTDDTDIYKQLKENNKDSFKQYHKYIAIVQADGDSLGETIKSLNDNSQFGEFSKTLLTFSQNAHLIIKEYGGVSIFAGGDDLLFFAPVVSGNKNIFQLVENLAEKFKSSFNNFTQVPTLSAGISITYYKYPMGEALDSANNLLKKAKNFPGKNAIAYEVQKHSGQRMTGVFNRLDSDYHDFMHIVSTKGEKHMLSSLIHKLAFTGAIIDEIGRDEIKTNNYFTNFFNEEEHKNHKVMIDSTANLINSIFSNSKRVEKKELIFSVLRLKKFLEGGE